MKMSIFSLIMSIIKAINDVIIKRSDIITTVVQYQLQYSVIPILTDPIIGPSLKTVHVHV